MSRGHRQGSITKEKGRHRVRVSLDDGTRRSLGTFDTHDEANAVLTEALRALEESELLTGAVTVASFGARVMDRRELAGIRSIRQERSHYRRHIAASSLGALPLVAVRRREVDAWISELFARPCVRAMRAGDGHQLVPQNKTLSRQMVVHAVRIARAIFADAVRDELIDVNPFIGAKVPKRPQTKDAWTFLTAEEIDAVLSCEAIPFERRVAYALAIFAGLRQGEVWGLHWGDVHLEGPRPEVVIRHSFRGPTKTGRIGRVPLLPAAVAALEAWRAASKRTRPDAYVFPASGGVCHAVGFDGGWNDKKERREIIDLEKGTRGRELMTSVGHKSTAGITRAVRFHDLRHTCASHLLMGTWGRAWRWRRSA